MPGGSAGPAEAAGTRVGTGTFYNNIKMACEDAEKLFQQFIPNGIPNHKLNYKLNITPSSGKPENTIDINITPVDRPPVDNESISINVTVRRTPTGTSEGYISVLQVGDWATGSKPHFLTSKRIGYFLILIYLYISRKLDVSKIELEDMAQIPKYYDFMGFISYKPEFSPEELTRYYYDDSMWKKNVITIIEKLQEKNNEDTNMWNWRNVDKDSPFIKQIKDVTPLHLPGSHGMGGGSRKRRFKKRKTKRRRTKKRKTKRRRTKKRKTKKRRKSSRRKYN